MEHRLINNGATMPSSDTQQLQSVRKIPLSDLPYGTRNIISSPQGSSLPREKGPSSDSLKVSGMKRRPSDYPPGPHHPSTCNNGTSGPLVYVRRKLEETGKVHTCGDMDLAISLKSRKLSDSERKGLSHQPDQMESRVSCSPAFSIAPTSLIASSCGMPVPTVGMPTSPFLPVEPSASLISSGIPIQTNSPSSNRVHWKERFLRLQMFLNICDQSNQEEYIQMLRSLSSVGRSKHAVELEKRAIHLLLEEGKELHRMKLLNALGKVSP